MGVALKGQKVQKNIYIYILPTTKKVNRFKSWWQLIGYCYAWAMAIPCTRRDDQVPDRMELLSTLCWGRRFFSEPELSSLHTLWGPKNMPLDGTDASGSGRRESNVPTFHLPEWPGRSPIFHSFLHQPNSVLFLLSLWGRKLCVRCTKIGIQAWGDLVIFDHSRHPGPPWPLRDYLRTTDVLWHFVTYLLSI